MQETVDLSPQFGQVVFDGGPDNVDIDVKVSVDHLVAHVPHVDPWYFRMGRQEFRGMLLNLAGGLADDLDIAYDGILIALVLPKGAHTTKTINIFYRPPDRMRDVFQIVLNTLRVFS